MYREKLFPAFPLSLSVDALVGETCRSRIFFRTNSLMHDTRVYSERVARDLGDTSGINNHLVAFVNDEHDFSLVARMLVRLFFSLYTAQQTPSYYLFSLSFAYDVYTFRQWLSCSACRCT